MLPRGQHPKVRPRSDLLFCTSRRHINHINAEIEFCQHDVGFNQSGRYCWQMAFCYQLTLQPANQPAVLLLVLWTWFLWGEYSDGLHPKHMGWSISIWDKEAVKKCMLVLWKRINHTCSLRAVTMLSDCCTNKTRIQKSVQEKGINFLASVLIFDTFVCVDTISVKWSILVDCKSPIYEQREGALKAAYFMRIWT